MSDKTCQNCAAALTGPYCAACGQKDLDVQKPFLALAHDYLESLFHLDHRVWKSLGLMLWAPGRLARRHLDGQRVRYVSPAQFYLIATVLFFVVLSVSNIGLVSLQPSSDSDQFSMVVADEVKDGATPRVVKTGYTLRAFVPLSAPGVRVAADAAELAKAIPDPRARELVSGLSALMANPAAMNALLEKWLPRLLILLVPLFALMLRLIAGKAAPMYGHAVFSIYFHGSLFVLLTVLVGAAAAAHRFAVPLPMDNVFLAVFTVLLGLGLHHMYGGHPLRTLLRLALSLLAYVAIFGLSFNALLAFGLS